MEEEFQVENKFWKINEKNEWKKEWGKKFKNQNRKVKWNRWKFVEIIPANGKFLRSADINSLSPAPRFE